MAAELEPIIARLRLNASEMRRGFDEMARKAASTAKNIDSSFRKMGQRVNKTGRSMALSVTSSFSKSTTQMRRSFNAMDSNAASTTKNIGSKFRKMGQRVNKTGRSMSQSVTSSFSNFTTQTRRGFDEMARKAASTTKNIGSKFQKLNERVSNIGRSMALSVITPIAAISTQMRRSFGQMVTKARDTTLRIGESFQKLGQRVNQIGRSMVLSVTAPFVALVGFSVKTASDVQEMENLIAVTFGNATQSVEEWADRTAVAVNRSSDVMLRAAGDFAAFLKPLGIAPDRIAPMSIALSQLVTDVSSFRNIAEQDVFIKFFSGLAGEPEAMRRLGVDIGQTAIAAELLALGFEGVAIEASQSQKVLARYNIIMRQTADAQGDAVRTSEFFENQTRGLSATIRDIRIAIGNQLLPVATELVGKLRVLGQRFLGLSDEAQRSVLIFGGIAAAIGPVLLIFGTLIRVVGFAASGLVQFGNIGVRAMSLVARAALTLIAPILSIPGAFAAVALAVFAFRDTVGATFKSIAEFAAALASPIVEPIRQAFQFIKEIAVEVKNFFVNRINDIISVFNTLVSKTAGLFGKAIGPIMGTIDQVEARIRDFVADLPEFNITRIRDAAKNDLDDIKDVFRNAIDGIKGLIPAGLIDFRELMDVEGAITNLDDLESTLNSVFTQFNDLGQNMNDHLVNASFNAKDLAEDLREAFIGRLADVNSLGDAMTAVFDRLKAQLLEIAFFGTTGTGGLFGGIFSSIAEGFAGIFGGARAGGGPVQRNRAFLVGEQGPELFVPPSAGTIVNAQATTAGARGGGDIFITQHINLPPDNTELTERMVTIASMMKDQAVSAFRQANNEGF